MAIAQNANAARSWVGTALVPAARRVGEFPEIAAIRTMLPFSFAGLLAGILGFALQSPAGPPLQRISAALPASFGVMSAVLVVLLAWDLARRRGVAPAVAVAASAGAFAISLPYGHAHSVVTLAASLGRSGLFFAIGIALGAVTVSRLTTRAAGRAIGAVLAIAVVLGGAVALAAHGISFIAVLDRIVAPLGTLGDSLPALLAIVIVETLLWVIGIHGPALVAAVVLPVYLSLLAQNAAAVAHGHAPPHIVTVSTFLFVFPGGAGATWPVAFLLARSGVKRVRTVALAALVPTIFNANEPLMFGLPIAFEPLLAIPFVTTPAVLAIVTYVAMAHGLVARPTLYIPSSVPQPLGVFLATKDWRAVILVIANIAIAAVIWWPFVAIYERHQRERPVDAT